MPEQKLATNKQQTYLYNLLRNSFVPEFKEIFDKIKGGTSDPFARRTFSGMWMTEKEYNFYEIVKELPQDIVSMLINIILQRQTRNCEYLKKFLIK